MGTMMWEQEEKDMKQRHYSTRRICGMLALSLLIGIPLMGAQGGCSGGSSTNSSSETTSPSGSGSSNAGGLSQSVLPGGSDTGGVGNSSPSTPPNDNNTSSTDHSSEIAQHEATLAELQERRNTLIVEKAANAVIIAAYMQAHPNEVAGILAGVGGTAIALNPDLDDKARVVAAGVAILAAVYYQQHPDEIPKVVEVADELQKGNLIQQDYQNHIDDLNDEIENEQNTINGLQGN
jgi:hypothetical protein